MQLRALLKRHERAPSCADMLPFVRTGWRVDTLDLTDASKWLTDASLGALSSLGTLRTLRLTACRYVSDGGLAFCAAVPLTALDISWTAVGDGGLAQSVSRCTSLTSLNLTGLRLSDGAMSSLLALTRLEKLSLASTPITDAALDYLTCTHAGARTSTHHRTGPLARTHTHTHTPGPGLGLVTPLPAWCALTRPPFEPLAAGQTTRATPPRAMPASACTA